MTLAKRLVVAVDEGRVQPYFQPIVSLTDGRTLGLEVLARWHDPQRGPISPEEFIPVADRFGLLDQLLDSLMRAGFAAAAQWPRHLFLGFNVSPTQLQNPELPSRVARAAADHGFATARVHIEVTESVFLRDLTTSLATLQKLIAMGCMIAMDDFGTGYSSLTWLNTLPFSKIKIDRSFVSAMEHQRPSRKIVSAVIGLGQSLGMAVVAEGVETTAQANLLNRMGCTLAQGFLFGRPMAADDVAAHLRSAVRGQRPDYPAAPMSLELRAHQLAALYRSEETAIAFIDRGGIIVDASSGFNAMMATPHGSAKQNITEFLTITPDMFAESRAGNLLNVSASAFEELTPSGRAVFVVIRPVHDENQDLLGYSVACRDSAAGRSLFRRSELDDPARLQAVADTGVLHHDPDEFFDIQVAVAAEALGVPTATIGVVERDHETLWSATGMSAMGVHGAQIPIERSLARYVVASGQPVIVNDAYTDPVLKHHPAVVAGLLGAFLGIPLTSPDGHVVGAFSVADTRPHHWKTAHIEILDALAGRVRERIFAEPDRRRA